MERQSNSVVVFNGDATRHAQARTVKAKIEDILGEIIDALSENRVLDIPLRSRRSGNESLLRFPASTGTEVKRFTCVLLVLHLCYEALNSGHVITKRNIYYQNPDLFGSQQYVDSLVDDIAFTFGVGRDALNIVAAYKGLIAGSVIITLKNHSVIDCSSDENGSLIPHAEAIRRVDIGETKWILVIEKEATFRGLAASGYYGLCDAGVGVLVTAKGFPDLVTRQFLHILHSAFPQIPIYALVDYDPSGIAIMLTYKCSSPGLSHEESITIPGILWLGPTSTDILGHTRYHSMPNASSSDDVSSEYGYDPSPSTSPHSPPGDSLSAIPIEVTTHLSTSDRRKAIGILRRLESQPIGSVGEPDLVHELQLMLMLNIKAEIQAVDESGDMAGWLDDKLSNYHF
ncbi:DNA topoisomerase IV, alpha subunit [Daldinia caldariorum]|uniref:DNA topoisomerase IV, alpha subunit n=1 Tax=Daldinia caldariorum TaxID=326644 RepID=UPI002007879B|nr:DNA topoisomerase IV, alpha subunit [Daldinia caldariorum]KAI1469872.1 DNA topoisomerase IV, alpha subunit [Daldinia caldariorum]